MKMTTCLPSLRPMSLLIVSFCALQTNRAQLVSSDSVRQTIQKNFRVADSAVVHLTADGDVEIQYRNGDSIDVEVRYFKWQRYIGRLGKEEPFALEVTESGNRIDIRPAERRSSVLFIGLGSKTELTYRISLPPQVALAVEMTKEGSVTVLGGTGVINELKIITHNCAARIDAHQANFKSFDVIRRSK